MISTVLHLPHVVMSDAKDLWSYVTNPSKWISSMGDKILTAALGSAATIWTLTKTQLWPRTIKLFRFLRVRFTGTNYILLWLDAEAHHAHKLCEHLSQRFPESHIRLLASPSALLRYPLKPNIVSSIILLDTDVTKLSSDEKVRAQVEKRLQVFLLRGGGIVGAHDVIYRRVRNESLERAFGGRITDFQRTSEPVKYKKADARHPIGKNIGDTFALNDGELLWGKWEEDVDVIFKTDDDLGHPLVVAREQGAGGRLVWLHSGDQREHLARSISLPEENFIKLLASSIEWVSRHGMRPANHPFVVAHRGIHLTHHENTVSAFEEAVAGKADFVELDVRRTRDGVLIVSHDPKIGLSDIAESDYSVLAEQSLERGFSLAVFGEVLQTLKGRIRLDIELKEKGYEREICDELRKMAWEDSEYVLTSFHDSAVDTLKQLNPSAKCGLLLGRDKPKNWIKTRWREIFPVKRLRDCNADFVAPNVALLKFRFCRRMTSAGFPVWVWTLNERKHIYSSLRKQGIEAIITDRVSTALKERASFHAELRHRRAHLTD